MSAMEIQIDSDGQESRVLGTVHPLTLTSLLVADHSVPEIDLRKADLMFFDAFACPLNLKSARFERGNVPPLFKEALPLIHWLYETGLLLDLFDIPGFAEAIQSFNETIPIYMVGEPEVLPRQLRLATAAARKLGYNATSIFGEIEAFDEAFGKGPECAYRILMENVPVPDYSLHSWEDIQALRMDTDVRKFQDAVLRWLNNATLGLDSGRVNEKLLEDELQQILSDHASRIQSLGARVRISALQTLLPLPASIAAASSEIVTHGAATLWGSALLLNGAFSLWRSYLDMREAENQPTIVGYVCRLRER